MASPMDIPEEKERKCAWVLYVLLLTTFVGYVVYTIVDGVAQREEPPTSFEKEQMAWSLPHLVAEGTRPQVGQCFFSLDSDDDDVERDCNVEFYADEDSEAGDEGVLVFFLGDFDISALRDEYEENMDDDDPEFDQSFVEGFVVLGFEEVGDLWETPVGLCAAQEFPAEGERNFESITDACPINTYVPIGPVRQGQDSQAYASNFVLEAEVFRTLEEEESFTYSSSVSSTIWNIESGSLDASFSSVNNEQSALSSKTGKHPRKSKSVRSDKHKASPSSWHHKHPHKPVPTHERKTRGIDLQQESNILGYAGQVWVYQQSWTVSVTEEQDPLDVLALFGQWGGAFTYVAIVFGIVFTAGKGGVRYNRFSKESREKYKKTPGAKKGKTGKKDKKKKKKKKKDKKDGEEDESESEEDESDDDDDEMEVDV